MSVTSSGVSEMFSLDLLVVTAASHTVKEAARHHLDAHTTGGANDAPMAGDDWANATRS